MTNQKAVMMAEIEYGFGELMQVIESMNEQQMLARSHAGAWSIKDELAHLAAWEDILLRFYIGNQPFADVIQLPGARFGVMGEDEINAHLFELHRGRPLPEIISYLQETHAAVVDELSRLTVEQLNSPLAHPEADPEKVSLLAAYVRGDTVGHYEEHLVTIRAAIAE